MKIGVLFALEVESAPLTNAVGAKALGQFGGVTVRKAEYKGSEVYIAVFGVGTVSASAATQLLISKFDCELLLNAGAAGGIAPDINIGDMVICTHSACHDFDPVILSHYPPYTEDFATDDGLRALAQHYCRQKKMPYRLGGVATGNAFVCCAADAADVYKRTNCLCVDMEFSGIAQTAARNSVPVLSVKAITDLADEKVAELKHSLALPYEEYIKVYTDMLCSLLAEV